jgi:hypothetical protein
VLWLRNNLAEPTVHTIYSLRERWLRILKGKADGRREGRVTGERYRGFHRGNVTGDGQASYDGLLRRGKASKHVASRQQTLARSPRPAVGQVGTVTGR